MLPKTGICTKCLREQPLECFNIFKKGKYGRHPSCKICKKIANRILYLKNGRQDTYTTEKHRKYTYGITEEEYQKLLEKSKGRCAVCTKEKPLIIDHCHVTNKIRGLLCHLCNQGIGKLGDTIEGVKAALEYLVKTKLG